MPGMRVFVRPRSAPALWVVRFGGSQLLEKAPAGAAAPVHLRRDGFAHRQVCPGDARHGRTSRYYDISIFDNSCLEPCPVFSRLRAKTLLLLCCLLAPRASSPASAMFTTNPVPPDWIPGYHVYQPWSLAHLLLRTCAASAAPPPSYGLRVPNVERRPPRPDPLCCAELRSHLLQPAATWAAPGT